jgi:hypothetical protein
MASPSKGPIVINEAQPRKALARVCKGIYRTRSRRFRDGQIFPPRASGKGSVHRHVSTPITGGNAVAFTDQHWRLIVIADLRSGYRYFMMQST